jgi:C1A family cysteine protease
MRFIILLALICSLEAIPISDLDAQWEKFKIDFERTYATPAEEEYRKSIFESTLQFHESHNALYAQGLVTHDVGVNQFSDWTSAEYEAYLPPIVMNMTNYNLMVKDPVPNIAAPDSFDWRSSGGVTPVKNQGQCGSCWAFATVAVIEGAEKIHKSQTVSLSEQELVDCDKKDGGCNGGNCDTALAYAVSTGLETETAYPYKAKNQACAASTATTHLRISSAHSLSHPVAEANLFTSIQNNGPTAVYIDASGSDFQNYKSGVITTGTKKLNHAVTAVGWTTNSIIIKNSWGTSWGQAGYFQLGRGNDVRGVNEYGFYASV